MPFFQNKKGVKLYYATDGAGDAVVLLHSLPLDHRIWWNQVFALAPSFRTMALDVRGFGLSEPGDDQRSIHELSEDVFTLMETERVEKAVIVGLSMGGSIAQQFAVDHPDSVKGLVLSGTFHSARTERLQKVFSNHAEGYGSSAPSDYFRSHVRLMFSEQGSEICKALLESYPERSVNFHNVVLLARALSEFRIDKERMTSIRVPTIVIAGEDDTALGSSREIADLIPDAKFVKISGAAHLVNVEKPFEYNVRMVEFLKEI